MIEELLWDTELLGRKTGRLSGVATELDLTELLSSAQTDHYRYLTCRTGEIRVIQLLEKHGFYMTDIGIIWERKAADFSYPEMKAREGSPEDALVIREISSDLFRDGRFYTDPFFSDEEADKIYTAWAENSLRGFADKVLLLEDKGFVTCKKVNGTGDIPLIGVARPYQGKGIGTALVLNALAWFQSEQITNVTVRTQANNSQAVKFYEQLGFHVKLLDATMAKVLDRS